MSTRQNILKGVSQVADEFQKNGRPFWMLSVADSPNPEQPFDLILSAKWIDEDEDGLDDVMNRIREVLGSDFKLINDVIYAPYQSRFTFDVPFHTDPFHPEVVHFRDRNTNEKVTAHVILSGDTQS